MILALYTTTQARVDGDPILTEWSAGAMRASATPFPAMQHDYRFRFIVTINGNPQNHGLNVLFLT